MVSGKYIVIEGSDGTGKTTQVELLRVQLKNQGIPTVTLHEPGGTPTAEALRTIIKDASLTRDPWTNVLLFSAARRLAWYQTIRPALTAGTWVLASRNWISTVAYQGYGEGIPTEDIVQQTTHDVDKLYLRPDVTLVLNLQDETLRHTRISQRGKLIRPDTFESKNDEFQSRVLEGYRQIATEYHFPLINASRQPNQVEDVIWGYIQPLLT